MTKVLRKTKANDSRIPKGAPAGSVWYDLKFGRDKKSTICYEQGQVFATKKDATLDMYVP